MNMLCICYVYICICYAKPISSGWHLVFKFSSKMPFLKFHINIWKYICIYTPVYVKLNWVWTPHYHQMFPQALMLAPWSDQGPMESTGKHGQRGPKNHWTSFLPGQNFLEISVWSLVYSRGYTESPVERERDYHVAKVRKDMFVWPRDAQLS